MDLMYVCLQQTDIRISEVCRLSIACTYLNINKMYLEINNLSHDINNLY